MPLAVASKAFIHPAFFPLNPFHLFYENCMPFFWDCWITDSEKDEPIHISAAQGQKLGELIAGAMETLPPSFCGPIHDPYQKRQSQYKAFEWMALLHWYILPIGIELGLNPQLLHVFSQFVTIIEFAMTITPRSQEELDSLQVQVMRFLNDYEFLYVNNDPNKVYRCCLCVFQLFHVPMHIRWFGSIRMGSQATVERSIGEVGHKIHSKKEPFANLTNIIIEQECIRIAQEYYPQLRVGKDARSPAKSHPAMPRLTQELHVRNVDPTHLDAIESFITAKYPDFQGAFSAHLYGKLSLPDGKTLKSQVSDEFSDATRKYRWFEAHLGGKRLYGEAVAFYHVELAGGIISNVAIYKALTSINQPYPTTIRGTWSPDSLNEVMDVSNIQTVVGIFTGPQSKNVYVLRKHPALMLLRPEERGVRDVLDSDRYGEADVELD
ncbi:hypothetical protein DFP72DRAFT_1064030 [Ephemerocybe angulata]|uniref:Uncharacterized protein n=1 Tax=Ephemerocybe angulata TaxID=980116 RepID=A0A8H6MCI0_9AGAR|nr:hypothetical protein DFP72DRAFT_1064030 [Tulosesus angulatus]